MSLKDNNNIKTIVKHIKAGNVRPTCDLKELTIDTSELELEDTTLLSKHMEYYDGQLDPEHFDINDHVNFAVNDYIREVMPQNLKDLYYAEEPGRYGSINDPDIYRLYNAIRLDEKKASLSKRKAMLQEYMESNVVHLYPREAAAYIPGTLEKVDSYTKDVYDKYAIAEYGKLWNEMHPKFQIVCELHINLDMEDGKELFYQTLLKSNTDDLAVKMVKTYWPDRIRRMSTN